MKTRLQSFLLTRLALQSNPINVHSRGTVNLNLYIFFLKRVAEIVEDEELNNQNDPHTHNTQQVGTNQRFF